MPCYKHLRGADVRLLGAENQSAVRKMGKTAGALDCGRRHQVSYVNTSLVRFARGLLVCAGTKHKTYSRCGSAFRPGSAVVQALGARHHNPHASMPSHLPGHPAERASSPPASRLLVLRGDISLPAFLSSCDLPNRPPIIEHPPALGPPRLVGSPSNRNPSSRPSASVP